jgi:phospholipid:diacylglycerol acyltransferase
LGFILIEPSDIKDIHNQFALFFDYPEISIKLPDIDLSIVESEWKRLRSNIPELWKLANDGREFQVGEEIKARGQSAHHPVILVPGIVSTVRTNYFILDGDDLIFLMNQGLESWSTHPDFRPFFREKLWGGFNMLSQVTFNKEKWISAMMLDPITGLDPPNAKIRAAEGINAASTFMQGYWLWLILFLIMYNGHMVDYTGLKVQNYRESCSGKLRHQ